ncbi:hypothetical protein ACJDU8_04860 [Clostridium sp. WILCCON 0269]|uniref:Phage protein n=1 Tax=Candidatus Clostridium eludens TaxID=3381663 RepID=A0ABW8SFU3_9CLOT
MKELLSKLIKNRVDIFLKSGDKIEKAIIVAAIRNALVVDYNGGIAVIEIPHIAYVLAEAGTAELMDSILSDEEDKDNDEKNHKKHP